MSKSSDHCPACGAFMAFSPVAGVKLCPACKDDGTGEKEKSVACGECGAELKFEAGDSRLKCPYCSHETDIALGELGGWSANRENDFHAGVSKMLKAHDPDMIEVHTVKCGTCAAETTLDVEVDTDECPYCGATLHRRDQATRKVIRAQAVLPFKVKREEAREKFFEWVRGLPDSSDDLREHARIEAAVGGVYLPFWTYDVDMVTFYDGKRGDVSIDGGRRSVEWRSVCGSVQNSFDDFLLPASESLPRDLLEELEPWDLAGLMPYQEEFLSGYRVENYSVDLATGFQLAREALDAVIDRGIREDIGGEIQKITGKEIRYSRITYKHVLLPVWVSAFRYQNQLYRFLVNARTGEVQGERPEGGRVNWGLVAAGVALLAAALFLALRE